MITRLHEVDPLRAHQLPWQLSLDGIDHAGVGDAQPAEELVGLEDLERIENTNHIGDMVGKFAALEWPKNSIKHSFRDCNCRRFYKNSRSLAMFGQLI